MHKMRTDSEMVTETRDRTTITEPSQYLQTEQTVKLLIFIPISPSLYFPVTFQSFHYHFQVPRPYDLPPPPSVTPLSSLLLPPLRPFATFTHEPFSLPGNSVAHISHS